MTANGGGGSISVEPVALEAIAARIASIAASTASARGSVSAATSAASGCAGVAAGSFARMHAILERALADLESDSYALSQAVYSAANAYTVTDATQMPAAPAAP